MPQARTQAMTRRTSTLTDQYGRKYSVTIEISTGDPCGLIALKGWGDPLRTPMKYLKIPREDDGSPMHGRISVNLAQWIKDQTHSQLDWTKQLWENGRRERKDKFDPRTAEQDIHLLDLTGPKPFPTVEVLKMALAGDRKLLGLEPLDKEYRVLLNCPTDADLLGEDEQIDPQSESYQEFAGRMMKDGKNMKEVGAMWQEQKLAKV